MNKTPIPWALFAMVFMTLFSVAFVIYTKGEALGGWLGLVIISIYTVIVFRRTIQEAKGRANPDSENDQNPDS